MIIDWSTVIEYRSEGIKRGDEMQVRSCSAGVGAGMR